MISSDFRAEARRKLSGKWNKMALCFLAYLLIFFIIGFIAGLLPDSLQPIISIARTVIEVPLLFGLILTFLKAYNDEEVKAFDFLTLGFSNFKKSWGVTLQTALKMIVPIILIIVSYILMLVGLGGTMASMYSSALLSTSSSNTSTGMFTLIIILGFILLIASIIWAITKSYYYKLAYIVAMENPDMTSKEAVLKSEEIMKGNRSKLFYLEISFIGWGILAACTFGIGSLWLLPYIQFATITLYKYVSGNNSEVKVEVEETSSNNDPIQ